MSENTNTQPPMTPPECVDFIKSIVAERPDFIYNLGRRRESCEYAPTPCVGAIDSRCIIGEFANRRGVNDDTLRNWDTLASQYVMVTHPNSAPAALIAATNITPDCMPLLCTLQLEQDRGKSWQDALSTALQQHPLPSPTSTS